MDAKFKTAGNETEPRLIRTNREDAKYPRWVDTEDVFVQNDKSHVESGKQFKKPLRIGYLCR